MSLSAWGLPTYALVGVFSDIFASVLGWGAYLDRQVASGLCDWRRLCSLSPPGDCWPSGYVFILPGSYHILADALYRPLLLPRSAWSLALTVFLFPRTPTGPTLLLCVLTLSVLSDLLLSRYCRKRSVSAGTDMFLHSWGCLQAYAFAPVAIIPLVLAKLRASSGTALPLVAPLWALRPWFPALLQHWLDHTVVIRSRRELLYIPRSRHLSRISVGSGISPDAFQRFP